MKKSTLLIKVKLCLKISLTNQNNNMNKLIINMLKYLKKKEN